MADTGEVTGWRPEPGSVVEGIVVELNKGWSDYSSSFYPIVTLRTADGGLVNVHCFQHVLRTRMMAIEPHVGTRIKITYHGKRATKDGKREVAVYTVESDKKVDSGQFWQGMSGPVAGVRSTVEPDAPIDEVDDIPF